ncbi:amino acid deaminase [Pollutimonas bauzanensis]|uniref:D-serine dehydratase n=1 Tax=Pollutimonas bauzanensis TaxID=658167 RepID=A0A1M5M4F1_9BURK|nr:amino acid deaminase [Pollutimonas bauzanensis]SHG72106.1 D-serine dehydratase [Pollutimonas bauzanensis]
MRSKNLLDAGFKGFPLAAGSCPAEDVGRYGWNLFKDDLPYPMAVIRQAELEHNLRWMQAFTEERGIFIAPHGKTTMSPQLFRRQLALGAWGLTFATVFQVNAGLEAGARRVIIANQVVGDADLDALAHMLARDAQLRIWFLVDSIAQVELTESWALRRSSARRFDCLLEIGIEGQRTGARTPAQALALAERINGCASLVLGGLECYEGGLAHCQTEHDSKEVGALMARVEEIARECDRRGLFEGGQIIISAGGSAVFDLVVPGLKLALSKTVEGILRSGCYITQDHDFYSRMLRNVEQRQGLKDSLLPALEVWTMVQSVPEPGLAILTCGKRDVSYDLSLPVVTHHAPKGSLERQAAPAGWRIAALNDQHAYLRFADGAAPPEVGDRVVLGISHPCTTFDKWTWLPIISETGVVVSAVSTRF